jgi:hypothetical protein
MRNWCQRTTSTFRPDLSVRRSRHYCSLCLLACRRLFAKGPAKSFIGFSVTGIVDHGNAVPTSRIAADLKRSREATLLDVERLEAGNYISRLAFQNLMFLEHQKSPLPAV